MSITIETSTQKMRGDAEEVEQLAGQYNTLQQEMFADGRDLDSTWSGDANQSFNSRLKNDEPRFNDLYKVINDYVGAVRESADDYDRTEAAVQDEMKSNTKRQSS
ncbi:MAG: WXG100 family type VII secretion target [Oscillospiraceae bacterium]|nr:WXG100 family type VII secretion target [Oscillospiraceae bacterium]